MVAALADSSISQVACGRYHTAALTSRGELLTWGEGRDGALGHDQHQSSALGHDQFYVPSHTWEPRAVQLPAGVGWPRVVEVRCGATHTVAMCASGEVVSCGAGSWGRLGLGDETERREACLVPMPA